MGIKTTRELGHAFEPAQAHEPVGTGKRNGADTAAKGSC
jgi:hypothetical protein